MKKRKDITFTDFEKKVYCCVLNIPVGEVRTYRWIARRIGKPKAYRAVGNVLAKNPFPFFIPCHRVVSAGGDIGNYSLGKKLKRELINFEKKLKDMIK